MTLTAIDCEIIDWLSRRSSAVLWSTVPWHWRRRLHILENDGVLVQRVDVVLVGLTACGRIAASAYRHGRAALAPGQRDLVG